MKNASTLALFNRELFVLSFVTVWFNDRRTAATATHTHLANRKTNLLSLSDCFEEISFNWQWLIDWINCAHRLCPLVRFESRVLLRCLFCRCLRWSIDFFIDHSHFVSPNSRKEVDQRRSDRHGYSTSTFSRTVCLSIRFESLEFLFHWIAKQRWMRIQLCKSSKAMSFVHKIIDLNCLNSPTVSVPRRAM